jgi:hypothetical protein
MKSALTNLITCTKHIAEVLIKCWLLSPTPLFCLYRIGGLLPIVLLYCSEFLCKAELASIFSVMGLFAGEHI